MKNDYASCFGIDSDFVIRFSEKDLPTASDLIDNLDYLDRNHRFVEINIPYCFLSSLLCEESYLRSSSGCAVS